MSIATLSRTASRRTSGFLIAAFLATASPQAHADEARLAWDACVADGGTTNAEFACDTNSGFHFITASFVLDNPVTTANSWGIIATINVGTIGTTSYFAGDWWRLSSDGCRPNAYVASADFTSSAGACVDPFVGTASAYTSPYSVVVTEDRPPHGSTSYGYFRVQVVANQSVTLDAGVEYLAFRIRFDHSRTVGSGACDGCCIHQDIMIPEFTLNTDPSTYWTLYNSPYVSWQGQGTLCEPVPARTTTLGRIRAQYR